MLIVVDIGNSAIHIGYFTEAGLHVQKVNTYPLRDVADYLRRMDEFIRKAGIEKKPGDGGIISSVVLSHTLPFCEVLRTLVQDDAAVGVVDHTMNTGLNLKVAEPDKLGADRIADAVAAAELYGAPVAVADFGTATTITAVDRDHNLIGGTIMPGVGLMNEMLGRGTSLLQEIPLGPPDAALGTDTESCIRSGLYFGTAGGVERILSEIERETGSAFRLVLTGGHAGAMTGLIARPHTLNIDLTLEGLRILHGKNRSA
ncbi:MAG: type III pantothenate kinase [Nitrospiraceae bacterium]|nr:type III pantothenate kinase [Nitrospiraceae bacterium]